VRWFCGGALGLVAAGCGSSTSPHGPPPAPIAFLAGNHQSDTVQAVLTQALIVKVSPPSGSSAAGQIIQFSAVPDTTGGYEVYPQELTAAQPSTFIADTTNAAGVAVIGVALGAQAGRARLVVKVPTFGFADTAVFTVLPGGPAALHSGPADTSVYVNGTVALHTKVVDRFGNPRSDPVSYHILSGPGTLSGSTVTVTGFGFVLVGASAGIARDTTTITGLPSGKIAASSDNGGIVTFNLDGSGYKQITTTAAGTVVWAPSGNSVVFDQLTFGGLSGGSPVLQSATVSSGSVSTLDNSGGAFDAWPAYSRDGTWIYYVTLTGPWLLRHVHPDGTGDGTVNMNSPGVQFPSPSPDGQSVAYIVPEVNTLQILNLSTGVSTPVGSVTGLAAAWSPTSDLIAVVTQTGNLFVVHTDGSGQTALGGSALYEWQIGWSPDGKWIIVRNLQTRKIDLVNPTSHLVLPIGFTGTEGSPSWH
jgi:WD40-like Beta Propeller Repeat